MNKLRATDFSVGDMVSYKDEECEVIAIDSEYNIVIISYKLAGHHQR